MKKIVNDFIKGFNSGYIISRYADEINIKQAVFQNRNTSFIAGLMSGYKEYKKEIIEESIKLIDNLRSRKYSEREI